MDYMLLFLCLLFTVIGYLLGLLITFYIYKWTSRTKKKKRKWNQRNQEQKKKAKKEKKNRKEEKSRVKETVNSKDSFTNYNCSQDEINETEYLKVKRGEQDESYSSILRRKR